MNLAEFQALFQSRLLAGAGEGDAPVLDALRESQRGAGRDELLYVYQSGYRIRLESFFHEDHSGLRALLGDETFDELIREFIDAHPPRDRNARWYTTGLPDYMAASPRWRDDRQALSMALFERAMVDAFDATDAEAQTVQALAAFSPEESPRLAFAFHPSLHLLELSAGTLAAYLASDAEEGESDETAPAPVEAPDPDATETVAVWRCNEETVFRELEADEYLALNEARAGHAFGDICQMAAFQQAGEIEPERLAQFLASWFEDGMITGVSLKG
ncbi:hypothetical protein AMST5_00420 [freshwater sediment metagenome]|uniref:Putative DNA-binding domain-containing protein n=1 Tax=freshwater sediment metagenome TaxID=556182 RepID=A0AA48LXS6_9ZZZZ